jgi:hypothetical protein
VLEPLDARAFASSDALRDAARAAIAAALPEEMRRPPATGRTERSA